MSKIKHHSLSETHRIAASAVPGALTVVAGMLLTILQIGCGGNSSSPKGGGEDSASSSKKMTTSGDKPMGVAKDGDDSDSDSATQVPKNGTTAAFTADELTQLCLTQPQRVEDKFHTQRIRVSGTIDRLSPNKVRFYSSSSRLVFRAELHLRTTEFRGGDDQPFPLVCQIAASSDQAQPRTALQDLRIGQPVTINGRLRYSEFGTRITVEEAVIDSFGKPPGDAPPAEAPLMEADLTARAPSFVAAEEALKALNDFDPKGWTESGELEPQVLELLGALTEIDDLRLPAHISRTGLQQIGTLASVRSVTIRRWPERLAPESIRPLAQLPHLSSLSLSNGVTAKMVAELASFPALRRLTLAREPKEPQAFEKLADCRHLQSLALRDCKDEQLARLASLTHLRSLDISSRYLQGETLEKLAVLPDLADLKLEYCPLTDAGQQSLAKLTQLRRLILIAGQARGFADLPCVRSLQQLQVLEVWLKSLGPNCGKNLAPLENLRSIAIRKLEGFGDQQLADMLANPKPHLSEIRFNRTAVGDKGLAALGAAQLPMLRRIYLDETKVTDAGIKHLKALPKLRWIYALETGVSQKAIDAATEGH